MVGLARAVASSSALPSAWQPSLRSPSALQTSEATARGPEAKVFVSPVSHLTRLRVPGLKSQHVTAIAWLAEVTGADVQGLAVGSKALTFVPRRPPTELASRSFTISPESSAASSLLVVQAILPYLLFASNDKGEPVELEVCGGTNVAWSPSFEYFDQVFTPTLKERFGVVVERTLDSRGWSLGPQSMGRLRLKVHPVLKGQTLRYSPPQRHASPSSHHVRRIDVSIVTPRFSHQGLRAESSRRLGSHFPNAELCFKLVEDSGDNARWSILVVAHSESGIRWARDILRSMPRKTKCQDSFIAEISRTLCREVLEEISLGAAVDEKLQDQLVSFQALAEGLSSFPRDDSGSSSSPEAVGSLSLSDQSAKRDKPHEPFGHGSEHARTVRWVASELLSRVEFYNQGDLVRGVGFCIS